MKGEQYIIFNFRKKVVSIFGIDLIFAFIFGSFARSLKIMSINDIDMFVLLNKVNLKKVNRFKQWYLKIHKKYNLIADSQYFYEVTDGKRLNKCLEIMSKASPHFYIKNTNLSNGIIWADALSSKYVAFTGNRRKFLSLRKKSENIVNKWVQELSGKLKKTPSIFFKQNIIHYN